MMAPMRILVTGALGQIGSELIPSLQARWGETSIVATDLRQPKEFQGLFEPLDATDPRRLLELVDRYRIQAIYHLAALLSATAEAQPQRAWEVNMGSLYAVLEVARIRQLQVFFPSSIGAFGPTTPKERTPQDTLQRPTTIYGVTKVAGELLCDYYHLRFGVDSRGLRFPGLISSRGLPGGGTTDYAVEMFYAALREGRYTCFLRPDTRLEMMYMPDALRAIQELMEAPAERLIHRNAFNVGAMSFTPAELAAEIQKHLPHFTVDYAVDPIRQAIAESWPRSLDDQAAREEWGWRPQYDLTQTVTSMLEELRPRLLG
jgi:nucleoside-diphosphate-sugar epimerase